MNLLYVAAALLVGAQLLGVYALISRKADLVFSVLMVVLLGGAVACGLLALSRHLG